jgi:glucose/arabinose dehydrogenase
LLYVSVADGGSTGDPLNLAQNLNVAFGKLLRIDPLGSNAGNGKYGFPADNPFANDAAVGTLGEIYASGLRNPQRFTWDAKNGNLFVADIGDSTVEEISLVTAGANLGWRDWEGSFKFVKRVGVQLDQQRSDPKITYPVVEYGQIDPLLQSNSAVTLGSVYRDDGIPQLAGMLLFGDNPSGEVFYVNADKLPGGGQGSIRRILFSHRGKPRTFLEVIKEKTIAQGKAPAKRADLRFGSGNNGQIFLLNKQDGIIRLLASSVDSRHTTP